MPNGVNRIIDGDGHLIENPSLKPPFLSLLVSGGHTQIVLVEEWGKYNLIGTTIDEKKLKQIGKEGVIAMICDSTNVFSPGKAGSESDVRESLLKIMKNKNKRIIVTTFASNVARI